MNAPQSRYRHASEEDNRLDWWLREYGRFPTRAQLLRIRQYQRAQKSLGRFA